MLSEADRKKAADILMAAQKERRQAVQLHVTFPDITIEDSYAISTDVADRKMATDAKLIGHKVDLTSKAMQRSSMIDEPDYGHILDDQMIGDGAKIRHAGTRRRPGLPTRSASMGTRSSPATSCSPARSPAWCSRRRAIRCTPISGRSAASPSSSYSA